MFGCFFSLACYFRRECGFVVSMMTDEFPFAHKLKSIYHLSVGSYLDLIENWFQFYQIAKFKTIKVHLLQISICFAIVTSDKI